MTPPNRRLPAEAWALGLLIVLTFIATAFALADRI